MRVKAGNRSEDEMAHLWLQVLPVHTPTNGPDPRLLLEEAWMRNWLNKDPGDIIPLSNLGSALAGQGGVRMPSSFISTRWRCIRGGTDSE